MRHADLWNAIDHLAAERGLTASGLARAAGLDPTAFNPSRRVTAQGEPRWPGTATLARVLQVAGLSLSDFARMMEGGETPLAADSAAVLGTALRCAAFSQLGLPGLFDASGLPSGRSWAAHSVHAFREPGAHGYAIRLDTAQFEPLFRRESTLILSPGAPLRPGDRAIVRLEHGPVCGIVVAWSHMAHVLHPIGEPQPLEIDEKPARTAHRIIAASL